MGNCNLHLRFVISTFWFRMGAWSFQDGCLAPVAPVPTGGLPTNDPKQIIKFSYLFLFLLKTKIKITKSEN